MNKPNILFIGTDQQNRDALGCMGNDTIITPNLDRLACEGMLFTDAYSNCPICTAFRINVFTGLYSHQTGTIGNCGKIPDGAPTIADSLNKGGYRTGFVGKWHIGASGNEAVPPEWQGGFTEFIGYQCYNGFLKNVKFFDKDGTETSYDGHRTDVTTDIALQRLEGMAQQEDPFALFVWYQAPHYPEQPSPEYREMYDDISPKPRKNYQEVDPYIWTWSPKSPRPVENCPDWQRYGNNIDEYLKCYNAMVTQIDANVGRILARLETLGIADNTIIVFTSDHGDMAGSHGMKGKGEPHEESAGIPLIIKIPGGPQGEKSDALITGIDHFPTMLDWAGLEQLDSLPGKNYAPFLRGEEFESDGPVFAEMGNWKMVRKGSLKLAVKKEEGETEYSPYFLTDLENDPYEMNNLVDNPAYADIIRELEAEIQGFLSLPKAV